MTQIEVCLDSNDLAKLEQNVNVSYNAGADRIELCYDLSSGGLTPSQQAISIARQAFRQRAGLLVMIRPRAGDFVYSAEELLVMKRQIEVAAQLGVNGVVFGTLTRQNALDEVVLQALMPLCHSLNLHVTFHRAFDQLSNKATALAELVSYGVNRVLSNGTPWGADLGAVDGISTLKNIIRWADNAIELVVGGGVNPDNIQQLHHHLIGRSAGKAARVSFHANSGVMQNDVVDGTKLHEMRNHVLS
ncbi:copper homeostasis protein CutC [Thalassotalea marina]|uniref:PF03932 family protein CutC n=1 Tax=Thalassotalea marina TaxID=1673741 RepID=A0A919BML8_9GAMM|nr:copper homeostasis protein CutC [Thalassotalea marina]GHG01906.1 copper homeostasis protein CutC [Thalassotalea marina]